MSKVEGDIKNIVKDFCENKWTNLCQLEASGTRGGVIILWDGRSWTGEVSSVGAYSITCEFIGKNPDLSWHLSSIYAPNDGRKRRSMGAARVYSQALG